MKPRRIIVNDLMQQGYAYLLTEPAGCNFPRNWRGCLFMVVRRWGNLPGQNRHKNNDS